MYTYDSLKIGDSNTFERTITDADALIFAGLSGDCNPIHLSDEFAAKSQFKRRIAHGLMVAGLFSGALTNAFPHSIYISQTLNFIAPVYIGDTIRAVVTCKEKLGKGRVLMQTTCYNQDGVAVIDGEGVTRLARRDEPKQAEAN